MRASGRNVYLYHSVVYGQLRAKNVDMKVLHVPSSVQ